MVISFRSLAGQYSWYDLTPSPSASATSSILVLLAELKMYGTFSFSAALALATSPSGLKILWTPTGAMAMGYGSLAPKT
jgi:hypothetical protein